MNVICRTKLVNKTRQFNHKVTACYQRDLNKWSLSWPISAILQACAALHKCNDWFENPSWLSKIFPRSIVLSLALSIVCFVFVIKPTKVWINLKHTWSISLCSQIEKKNICNFGSPVRRYCAKSPRTVKSHNNCWNLPAISANSCEPECLDNSRWRRSKADF